jgi:DNA-binding transcriptional regulator PaaX
LVRATGIDRSTLADMVARMISKGLLARERSVADARANIVRLTDFGRAAMEAAAPRVDAADQRLLDLLGAKKRQAFMDALRKLAKASESALAPDGDDKRGGADENAAAPAKKTGKKAGKKKSKGKANAKASAHAPQEDADAIVA